VRFFFVNVSDRGGGLASFSGKEPCSSYHRFFFRTALSIYLSIYGHVRLLGRVCKSVSRRSDTFY
jgi:hypothetical protein